MLITRTPLRISFMGGGTDMPKFYEKNGGAVLSTSINKYIYLSGHEYFYSDKMLIKYSETEEVSDVDEIKHKIIREVFRRFKINSIDFNSTADIPGGTGMGSSSTFTSGLIKLCSEYTNKIMTNLEIAEFACDIEINILNEPIGKQDQYAASIGGLNLIQFNSNGTTEVKPLQLPFQQRVMLENNLHLFYTGINRSASKVLKTQNENLDNDPNIFIQMNKMKEMVFDLYDELSSGNNDSMGFFLNEGWQIKKKLASGISDSYIDEIYLEALNSGATGGKLLGAGGGGFLLFYCPEKNKLNFLKKFNLLKKVDFKFDNSGTTLLFKN
jgi:D-glycero-alpha-D-manno-heptose-7-phosphate kinase